MPLLVNEEKYVTAGEFTDDNTIQWMALSILDNYGYKHMLTTVAFSRQQWLCERALTLPSTYNACLVHLATTTIITIITTTSPPPLCRVFIYLKQTMSLENSVAAIL